MHGLSVVTGKGQLRGNAASVAQVRSNEKSVPVPMYTWKTTRGQNSENHTHREEHNVPLSENTDRT